MGNYNHVQFLKTKDNMQICEIFTNLRLFMIKKYLTLPIIISTFLCKREHSNHMSIDERDKTIESFRVITKVNQA